MALLPRASRHGPGAGPALMPGAVAMFAFLAICGVVTLVAPNEAADAAGALGVFVGSLVTGWLFLSRAAALEGRERLGWSLIGGGMLIGAFGVLTVGAVYLFVGDAPTFGWPDLFFFGTYAAIIVGFSVLPHLQGSPMQRSRMVLDGLIGAVSIGALLWFYVLSVLLEDLQGSPASVRIIGGIYPFLDLIALTVAMLVLLRRSVYRFDPRFALFSIGIVFQVVGDILFLVAGHTGSFEEAEPVYVMNLIALAAFFGSALLLSPGTPTRQYAEREPPLWTVIAPYLPAVGMLTVFILETYLVGTGVADPVLLGATVLVGLLVIGRQAVAIVENRRYIEQQRNALVSTISHELRTPLTSIVGFVELLQEGGGTLDEGERDQMLAIVHQQADYMARIVSDLIMLARDSGKDLRLDLAPVSLLAVARRSIPAAGISERSVTVECDPSLIAYVDPNRIQQVFVNLLSNADRYGGPNRLVRVVTRGSDVIIEVHDDGDGIPKRHEVRVWDRFERGPNRLNAAIPGSGIGLAIVNAIAVAHGGTASYRRSEELGGACFTVFLPARASLAVEERAESHRTTPVSSGPVA